FANIDQGLKVDGAPWDRRYLGDDTVRQPAPPGSLEVLRDGAADHPLEVVHLYDLPLLPQQTNHAMQIESAQFPECPIYLVEIAANRQFSPHGGSSDGGQQIWCDRHPIVSP